MGHQVRWKTFSGEKWDYAKSSFKASRELYGKMGGNQEKKKERVNYAEYQRSKLF